MTRQETEKPTQSLPSEVLPSVVRRTHPLHISILRLVTGLVIATALGIGVLTYQNTERAVNQLSRSLIEKVSEQTVQSTRAYLAPAEPTLTLNRDLMRADSRFSIASVNLPDEENWRARAALFLRVLRTHPDFNQVYYGDRHGDFVSARHDPKQGYLIDHRWITRRKTHQYALFRVDAVSGKWIYDEARSTNPNGTVRTYDPRERVWYKAALEQERVVWTDPYLFADIQAPGITAALRVLDPESSAPLGVLGVDFELRDLDRFVAGIEMTGGGRVFVLTEEGGIVGHPERKLLGNVVKTTTGSQAALPVAVKCADPLLNRFAVTLEQSKKTQKSVTDLEFKATGQDWLGAASTFPVGPKRNWKVLVAVPTRTIVGVVQANTLLTISVCLFVLLLSVGLGAYLSVQVARPLRKIASEMQRVGQFDIPETPSPASVIEEVDQMGQELDKMKASLRSFQKYVPSDVVQLLHHQSEVAHPGGKTTHITVLFADIIGFSAISEQMAPDALVEALTDYLEVMEEILHRNRGILDKLSGDSLMAYWGASIRPVETPELLACSAAMDYVERLRALKREPERGKHLLFETGIGIHTGDALVGNIGTSQHLTYTAIGDTVNVTSRIEALTRLYKTPVLISETTWKAVQNDFETRPIDTVAVKGRLNGIALYELMDRKGRLSDPASRMRDLYSAGLELYRVRKWDEAIEKFLTVLDLVHEDGPTRVLLQRAEELRQNPPPEDWHGVTVMMQK